MYNWIYVHLMRNSKVLTQLPFEIKMSMPPTDRGRRGYSDTLVANLRKQPWGSFVTAHWTISNDTIKQWKSILDTILDLY